mmetsp:Transcript_22662/g.70248  ORF Transcript_22662/g.70248 Transcript_22662/m.70248 type:complete len:316 (-) Transcript_22662:65-1012(-)
MSSLLEGLSSSRRYTKALEWLQFESCVAVSPSTTLSCASAKAPAMGRARSAAVLPPISRTPCMMLVSSSSRHSDLSVLIKALSSALVCSSGAWPTHLSSRRLMGHVMGRTSNLATRTAGAKAAAKDSWLGPVKMADGMISPKMRTTVMESRMASQEGTRESRKIGSASLAAEFSISNVTSRHSLLLGFRHRGTQPDLSKKWPEIKGRTLSAHSWSCNSFAWALLCSMRSATGSISSARRFCRTFKANSSMDVRPNVSPAAIAAQSVHTTALPTSKNHGSLHIVSVVGSPKAWPSAPRRRNSRPSHRTSAGPPALS